MSEGFHQSSGPEQPQAPFTLVALFLKGKHWRLESLRALHNERACNLKDNVNRKHVCTIHLCYKKRNKH